MRRAIAFGLLVCGCLLLAGAVRAEITILDFAGFLYEDGGFPSSNVGDVLSGVGFIEGVGAELDWDPSLYQLTFYITDLVSTGEYDAGGGMLYVLYTGGTIWVVADYYGDTNYTDGDYGVNPPNGTAPSTFIDGEIFLTGVFADFYMTYHPTLHAGSYEGFISWTGGTQLNSMIEDPAGYTLAGTVDPLGAPVPEGYDLEGVGHISFDPVIPVEPSSWGEVKNLYR